MPHTAQNISTTLDTPLQVGSVTLRNRVFLAPMSGVSDLPFRKLAWRWGAGMVVSEMVASQALLEGEAEMRLKILGSDIEQHVVQIAGREAKWMGLAAKMAQENGAQIVDINMGCPARRVTTGYSGSALMRDLDHALSLIDAVVESVEVPVTLKMRLGWDDLSINAPQLAAKAEAAGVKMITVHGRTRCQFYKGTADWKKIGLVRDSTNLPLVVNGDIRDTKSAHEALVQSGADALMVGRASYGAPWLPGQIANGQNCNHLPLFFSEAVISHYEDILHLYGREHGNRIARKHLSWYLDKVPSGLVDPHLRKNLLTQSDPNCALKLLVKLMSSISPAISQVNSNDEKVAA